MFDPRVDSIISELKRLNQHFCKKVKCCLGISNTGDPNLVLNQQGDWIPTGSTAEVPIVLFASTTKTIITGKTAETSIYSIPLPIDGSDYIISVYSQAQIGAILAGGVNHLLKVGTYPSPIDGATGANSIGQQTAIAVNAPPSANNGFGIDRGFGFRGGASGSIVGLATSQNVLTDKYSYLQFITLATKDFTTQHYLYVSFRTINVGHIITHNEILVTAIKI